MSPRAKKWLTPLLLLTLVALSGAAGGAARSARGESAIPALTPGDLASVVVMSGFRPIAVDILWIRADDLTMERRYYELLPLYKLITSLDPYFEGAWVYNSHNLAFNLAQLESVPEKRWQWMREGLLYATEGIKKNPGSDQIAFAIAWIYFYFHRERRDEYFTAQVENDRVLNPDGLPVLELARRWAQRGFQVEHHVVYIDWVLESIYRHYADRATEPALKLKYHRKRLEVWQNVLVDKPYAANKAREKIAEIEAAISKLRPNH